MKNYPKIIFDYSWIYDEIWKEVWILKKEKIKEYPSTKKILNYIKKVEKLWKKEEKKILQELSKITHLEWKSKIINCYVVGKRRPFSSPLTMPIYEKHPDYFIDVLIHELIHNLFFPNYKKMEKAWKYIERKYKTKSKITKIHIPLHAVHSHIYLKFYSEKRLKRDIEHISRFPEYKKSWDIVQKEGYKNIINEFVKRIKK